MLLPNRYKPHMLLISVVYDIGQLLSTGLHSDGLIEAAKGLLSDAQTHKRRKILSDLLLNLEDRSELESQKEDEDWFAGTVEPLAVLPRATWFTCKM